MPGSCDAGLSKVRRPDPRRSGLRRRSRLSVGNVTDLSDQPENILPRPIRQSRATLNCALTSPPTWVRFLLSGKTGIGDRVLERNIETRQFVSCSQHETRRTAAKRRRLTKVENRAFWTVQADGLDVQEAGLGREAK
jgi:hypothetical protein